MKGYIKLPRELTRDEMYYRSPFERPRALLDIILLATYKERTLRKGNAEIIIEPGEVAYSTVALSKRWKRSRNFVLKVLKEFASMGLIEVKTNPYTTIIKIKNWEQYRNNPDCNGQDEKEVPLRQNENLKPPEELNQNTAAASDPEARGLAAFLLSEIRKNDPYLVIQDTAEWDLEISKILNEFGIPPVELRRVIELSQSHPFWKKHVVSPSTLRLHFHALFIEMKEKTKKQIPEEWRLCYER